MPVAKLGMLTVTEPGLVMDSQVPSVVLVIQRPMMLPMPKLLGPEPLSELLACVDRYCAWTMTLLLICRSRLWITEEQVAEIVGPLDFWNTHQNSHVFPGLFQAFVKLGRELNIPAMRCHRRITVPRDSSERRYQLSHPRYWLKGQVIAWWSFRAEALGTVMPDARVYAPGYVEPRTMIEEIISRLPWSKVKKAVELVIHPATAVREDLFGTLTESRIAEYQTFKNPKLADRLRQSGTELVRFETLHRFGQSLQ